MWKNQVHFFYKTLTVSTCLPILRVELKFDKSKMKKENFHNSQMLLYQTGSGEPRIEVRIKDETVWLTQTQMAELFQKSQSTINEHIRNVYEEGELVESETMCKFGNSENSFSKPTNFYNLDVIISVGYRVKSHRGTQFRIWATKQLREFIIKGFVLDEERLSEGRTVTGTNYFKDLYEKIREIRASEKNLYDKVKDIFATSIDYNASTEHAKEFYSTVQNKFHYAITGYTAAELVVKRISGRKENLGLTNWKGEKVTQNDAKIAKNYLLEKELKELYLLVEQFLSFAELQISREHPMYMVDWKNSLDDFVRVNKLEVLNDKGKISHEKMEQVVKREIERYVRS